MRSIKAPAARPLATPASRKKPAASPNSTRRGKHPSTCMAASTSRWTTETRFTTRMKHPSQQTSPNLPPTNGRLWAVPASTTASKVPEPAPENIIQTALATGPAPARIRWASRPEWRAAIRPIIYNSIRRGHEGKNDRTDSGAVLCRGSSVLRRRRKYGHLEAERGQIEARPRGAEEQHGCLRGRGRQRENHRGWHRQRW